jgi:hypothetical protein
MVLAMQRYKFQAPLCPAGSELAAVPLGEVRRMVVHGGHHDTRASQYFTGLVANNGEGSEWRQDDHLVVTIALICDDPGKYFGIGDKFALWLGTDIAGGVVTRRLFI